jgi:hypothetical protein
MAVFSGLYESPGPPPSGRRIAMTTETAIKVGTYYIFVLFAVALAAAGAIWSE